MAHPRRTVVAIKQVMTAVLVGQVYGDSSIRHLNIDAWYTQTAKELRDKGWTTIFRPHPKNRRTYVRLNNVVPSGANLQEDLARASLVVTANSNVAVDATIEGIPSIATDKGSMVWGIVPNEIPHVNDDLSYFRECDRQEWAAKLVYKQFTKEELQSGYYWELAKKDF